MSCTFNLDHAMLPANALLRCSLPIVSRGFGRVPLGRLGFKPHGSVVIVQISPSHYPVLHISIHVEIAFEDSLLEVIRLGTGVSWRGSRLGSLSRRSRHLGYRPSTVVSARWWNSTGTRR